MNFTRGQNPEAARQASEVGLVLRDLHRTLSSAMETCVQGLGHQNDSQNKTEQTTLHGFGQ